MFSWFKEKRAHEVAMQVVKMVNDCARHSMDNSGYVEYPESTTERVYKAYKEAYRSVMEDK